MPLSQGLSRRRQAEGPAEVMGLTAVGLSRVGS